MSDNKQIIKYEKKIDWNKIVKEYYKQFIVIGPVYNVLIIRDGLPWLGLPYPIIYGNKN